MEVIITEETPMASTSIGTTTRHGGDDTTDVDRSDGEYSDASTQNRKQKRHYTKTRPKSDGEKTGPTDKKKAKTSTHPLKSPPPIAMRNKFEILQREENAQVNREREKQQQETTENRRPPETPKKIKPPPIVVHGRPKDYKTLDQSIKNAAPGGHIVKFSKVHMTVQTTNPKDWEEVKNELAQRQVEFHTFTPRDEKTHSFVLKGLEFGPTTEEITQDLKEMKIDVRRVIQMRTNYPMYIIVTGKEATLKQLQNRCSVVLYTKIQWERYINRTKLIQCKKCQEWGHGYTNCFAKIRCPVCAESHEVQKCPVDANAEEHQKFIKCANCMGNHVATSHNCKVFIKKMEAIESQNTTRRTTTRYVPAPTPTRNVWDLRREQQQQQQQQLQHPQQQTRRPNQQRESPVRSGNTSQPNTSNSGDASELIEALDSLKSCCNIGELVRALKDLTQRLTGVTDKKSKFLTVLSFTDNLDSYDF